VTATRERLPRETPSHTRLLQRCNPGRRTPSATSDAGDGALEGGLVTLLQQGQLRELERPLGRCTATSTSQRSRGIEFKDPGVSSRYRNYCRPGTEPVSEDIPHVDRECCQPMRIVSGCLRLPCGLKMASGIVRWGSPVDFLRSQMACGLPRAPNCSKLAELTVCEFPPTVGCFQ